MNGRFDNPRDFIFKCGLVAIVLGGAIFLQATQGAIPNWLLLIIPTALSFALGVSVKYNGSGNG